jgi:hypothetical protein
MEAEDKSDEYMVGYLKDDKRWLWPEWWKKIAAQNEKAIERLMAQRQEEIGKAVGLIGVRVTALPSEIGVETGKYKTTVKLL